MDMIPVSSSAIRAVGYDHASGRMKITFEQGDTYDFCGVPEPVYQGLMNAISKGAYYNDHIRDRYQCY
ncbi:KTSC domain-containing protein [Thiohalobacter sp. COW1]|uniref:KTSC domain-containing protein n=1 Tax=Thiohalobacter sp. COW1 TaxID=2795687 RepID=UPI0019167CFA